MPSDIWSSNVDQGAIIRSIELGCISCYDFHRYSFYITRARRINNKAEAVRNQCRTLILILFIDASQIICHSSGKIGIKSKAFTVYDLALQVEDPNWPFHPLRGTRQTNSTLVDVASLSGCGDTITTVSRPWNLKRHIKVLHIKAQSQTFVLRFRDINFKDEIVDR
ncbi:uncharacterized protein MELLADRAFT_103924 [Melampsora larici-populina 98AG31]|uniref:Uncharacterized protein n=1 Tax=Melampsora larici-populina (strain 98AG31 / pathotype 3-4-7) TaxID=747676 RepID=F4RD06_MELLP|nr:uncharacterized protein MELLADRAFT_103924 [Melampsora larici-populina 98AG31]EGG09815.1 hypothetical protein MELLADRAFT_103924 [Melampsora larici-populina 98AG31]